MLYSPRRLTLNSPIGAAMALRRGRVGHDLLEDLVVGDVVPRRLGHAAVALAGEGEDVDAELLLHLPGDLMDVVTDETHRTRGMNGDGLRTEDAVRLTHRLPQLLLSAEDDLLLGHVRGEAVGHEVRIGVALRSRLIASREPGVIAATDRAHG